MTDFFQAFGINKRRVWKEETRKTKRPGVERATSGLQLKRRARICTESLEVRLLYHLGGGQAPPTLTSGVNKAARCTFTSFLLRIVLHEPYRRSPVWLRPERSESLSSCFLPDWKAHFELQLILLATDRKHPRTRWVAATPLVDRLRALTSRWSVGRRKRPSVEFIYIHISAFHPTPFKSRLPNEQLWKIKN